MSFLTFIIFDLISFLIKLVFITIILLIFKDKIADYILQHQFDKGFGKLKDNIMSINFDDFEDIPNNTEISENINDSQNNINNSQTPT